MARNYNFQEIEKAGYDAGRNAAGNPAYNIHCPFDGRTKEGRAWWRGFMNGDAKRCAVTALPDAPPEFTADPNEAFGTR